MRKKYLESTLKRLFALSGNVCYFPDCTQALVEGDKIFAEICHIGAAEPGGERYDPNQSDEDRRSFSNLLLMCPIHHIETNDVAVYTTEVMLKIKSDHETRYKNNRFQPNDNILQSAYVIFNENQNNKITNAVANNLAGEIKIGTQVNIFEADAKKEEADWGIIGEIMDFVVSSFQRSTEYAAENMDIKDLEEKISLNFESQHAERVNEMVSNLWPQKQIVQKFIIRISATRPHEVICLKEKIQSDFFSLNKGKKKIEDVHIIEKLAENCLPVHLRTNPQYSANAKALVLYFFELCEIGAKTKTL